MGEEAEDEELEKMVSWSVESLGRKGDGKEKKAGCVLGKSWAIWSRRMTTKGQGSWCDRMIGYQRILGCERWGVFGLARAVRRSAVMRGPEVGVGALDRG